MSLQRLKQLVANPFTGPVMALVLCAATAAAADDPNIPRGAGSYKDFVSLFGEFVEWRGEEKDGSAARDYSQAAVDRRMQQLQEFRRRAADMNVASWSRSERTDYLAALSQLDEQEFVLRVHRPWSRDPGFYVDQLVELAYTDLPVSGKDRDALLAGLKGANDVVASARKNLRDVPADLADLALRNLSKADGVGSQVPYRAVPPEGVLGWYDDLLSRARAKQPELTKHVTSARAAVEDLNKWLTDNRPQMNGRAGIGREQLDWYLKHAKSLPYSSDDIVVLAQRELDRFWAFTALDRHRYRNLPELTLPASREEYHERLVKLDADIRKFLVKEKIITIPDYIPADFNDMRAPVPWLVRSTGPNYWEAIQYRDPSPDHWHATIPGHGFDGVVSSKVTHPVRRHIRDGARTEGWGLYWEEAPLQLGFYEQDRQRTRELIYNFGIFRAVRTLGDVWLQRNQKTSREVIEFWMSRTPYLDADVSRVDVEVYLRRPPGYGLGYTIGGIQMQKLLADRRRQLGDKFVLQDFHDQVLASGRLPVSLLRYDMTGLDDEINPLWKRTPLSEVVGKR